MVGSHIFIVRINSSLICAFSVGLLLFYTWDNIINLFSPPPELKTGKFQIIILVSWLTSLCEQTVRYPTPTYIGGVPVFPFPFIWYQRFPLCFLPSPSYQQWISCNVPPLSLCINCKPVFCGVFSQPIEILLLSICQHFVSNKVL